MRKLKPGEKRVLLSFIRPEDLELLGRLEAMAFDRRYDLDTFILLSLQEAFRGVGTTPEDSPVPPA